MGGGAEDDTKSDTSGTDDTDAGADNETAPANGADEGGGKDEKDAGKAPQNPKKTNVAGKDQAKDAGEAQKSKDTESNDGDTTKPQSRKKFVAPSDAATLNPFAKKPELMDKRVKKPTGDEASLAMRYACLAEGSLAKDNTPYRYTRMEYFTENGVPIDDEDQDANERAGSRMKDAAIRAAARKETFLFNPDALMYFTEDDLQGEEALEAVIEKYFETSGVSLKLLENISESNEPPGDDQEQETTATEG